LLTLIFKVQLLATRTGLIHVLVLYAVMYHVHDSVICNCSKSALCE